MKIIDFLELSGYLRSLLRAAIVEGDSSSKNQLDKLLNEIKLEFPVMESYDKEIYRARVISVSNYKDIVLTEGNIGEGISGIHGFSKEKMGTPPADKVGDGRCNPEGTVFLYVASDIETACAEVQPKYGDKISVIGLKMQEGTRVLDIRQPPASLCQPDASDLSEPSEKVALARLLVFLFSTPCFDCINSDKDLYNITQYFVESLRTVGVDGIAYPSCQNNQESGFNFVLFDPERAFFTQECGEMYQCLFVEKEFQNLSKDRKEPGDVEVLSCVQSRKPVSLPETLALRKNFQRSSR